MNINFIRYQNLTIRVERNSDHTKLTIYNETLGEEQTNIVKFGPVDTLECTECKNSTHDMFNKKLCLKNETRAEGLNRQSLKKYMEKISKGNAFDLYD